ncbi:phthiocerol/phthiodiolone dimycocerosyl transferase family protein [Nocardia pseudobrasiliensis]|uniref:phthiocerol/phthiodiolone dimycocerosyl transferase family protein n=1 Tax=Nocardia pseudobrasiliensis TaxID=45979 RepID=UPI000830350B|nr:hypothetical protein [Nocardia pseudobrasiliensis]
MLDIEALGEAYTALCRRYPFLGAYLEPTEKGYVLVRPPVFMGKVRQESPKSTDFQPWLERRPQSAVCVEQDSDGARVSLLTHHCVADSRYGSAAFQDLWRLYTQIVLNGKVEDISELPEPQPIESLLTARGVGDISSNHAGGTRFGQPNSAATLSLETARRRFTVAETNALTEFGGRNGLTVHGILAAAIILAEKEVGGQLLSELYYTYPVDLRERLTPPVAPAGGTNVLGYVQFNPDPTVAPELSAIGTAVNEQLTAGLSTGAIVHSLIYAASAVGTSPSPTPGKIMTTSAGRIADFITPPGLIVEDLTTIVSPRMLDPTNRRGLYAINSFGGRLSIEIHHRPGAADIENQRLAALTDRLIASAVLSGRSR